MRKRLTPSRKWRFPLMRWHRRIGLVVSLLVLWLSITGVLLNHTDDLALDSKPVAQTLLQAFYGIESPTVTSYLTGGQWLSHLGGNHIYLGEKEVAYCTVPFSGAIWYKNQYVVSCGDGLLLLTAEGEILERLGAVYGFPQPVLTLAEVDDLLLLKTPQGMASANFEQLQWRPYQEKEVSSVNWIKPQQAPAALAAQLITLSSGGGLTWERVILDLHNGRLVGRFGVWLLDISAILLIVLAVSGVCIWASSPSR